MFDPERLIGRVVGGQYRIERLLGQGGFGAVYRATDTQLDRPVAVKVITHGGRADLVQRFRREAQVQARLRHPSIVRLLEFDVDGAMPIMVQEFVDGRTLRSIVQRDGPLSIERAVRLFAELLDALDEAHAHGVVHRDLKPDNIMVVETRRGEQARLLDFGIAKIIDEDDDHEKLTATGMLLGTPSWLAPEQVTQQPITCRSDLYSLGCVLFWALTGDKPYHGTMAQVLAAHASAPPPAIPAHLPAHVGATLTRAMAKDPADRFESADDMRAALLGRDPTASTAAPLTDGPDGPTPLSISNLAPDLTPRPPRRAGPVTALVLLAVVAFAGAFALRGMLRDTERGDASPPVALADAGPTPSTRAGQPLGPDAEPPPSDPSPAAADAGVDPPDAAPDAAPDPTAQRRDRIRDLDARLDRDLGRCACRRARGPLDMLRRLGVDRRARWSARCGSAADGPLGACGAALERQLDAAMASCPCHGDETRALVDRLRREFGVDRRRAWARRCTTPDLPGSCM